MKEGRQEYAIAGNHREFLDWAGGRPERRRVEYLTRERAQALLDKGARKGKLHRIGMWERSDARDLAERLEE